MDWITSNEPSLTPAAPHKPSLALLFKAIFDIPIKLSGALLINEKYIDIIGNIK